MSSAPYYAKGQWLVICDQCGRQYKSSELRQRWDGLMVCQQDWEPRQPQDFVRGVADIQAPPWARPESSDTFLSRSTWQVLPTYYKQTWNPGFGTNPEIGKGDFAVEIQGKLTNVAGTQSWVSRYADNGAAWDLRTVNGVPELYLRSSGGTEKTITNTTITKVNSTAFDPNNFHTDIYYTQCSSKNIMYRFNLAATQINADGSLTVLGGYAAATLPFYTPVVPLFLLPNEKYLYIAAPGTLIFIYPVNSDGTLGAGTTQVSNSVTSCPLTSTFDSKYLYMQNNTSGGVDIYRVNTDGSLSFVETASFGSGYLACHPTKYVLYSLRAVGDYYEHTVIETYTINPATGHPTLVGTTSGEQGTEIFSVDPLGRYISFAARWYARGGTIFQAKLYICYLDGSGAITSEVFREFPSYQDLHFAQVSPDGRYLIVAEATGYPDNQQTAVLIIPAATPVADPIYTDVMAEYGIGLCAASGFALVPVSSDATNWNGGGGTYKFLPAINSGDTVDFKVSRTSGNLVIQNQTVTIATDSNNSLDLTFPSNAHTTVGAALISGSVAEQSTGIFSGVRLTTGKSSQTTPVIATAFPTTYADDVEWPYRTAILQATQDNSGNTTSLVDSSTYTT